MKLHKRALRKGFVCSGDGDKDEDPPIDPPQG